MLGQHTMPHTQVNVLQQWLIQCPDPDHVVQPTQGPPQITNQQNLIHSSDLV